MLKYVSAAILTCFFSFCSVAAGFCEERPKVRLVLDFALQGQQSPFILAADDGYFARAGVDVLVDPGSGSADSIAKVAAGAYDMAFADLGAMIQFDARNGGDLISVFQVYDVAPMVVLALKSSGIRHPADLVGKNLASPTGGSSRTMFPVFAAANNFDVGSIHWLNVTPQLREAMLVQKRADATVALATDLAGLDRLHLYRKDLTILKYADYGVDLYGHGIIVKRAFATAHPDVVKKVLIGFTEALKVSIKDPAIAVAALHNREPLILEPVERDRLQNVIDDAILTSHVKTEGLSSVEDARLQKTLDIVTSTFNLPALAGKSAYSSDYLPPRAMRMMGEDEPSAAPR